MSLPRISDISLPISKDMELKIDFCHIYIDQTLKKNSPKDIHKLINKIINFPFDILTILCQKNPEFEKFCRNNAEFKKKLSEKLDASGHLSLDLKTMDGNYQYQVFDLYLAASYMGNFKSIFSATERSSALKYACDLGLNDALLTRCMTKDKALKNSTLPAEQKDQALASILADTHQLSNLYWGLGYIQAGCILNAMADHFSLEGEHDREKIFQEQAIKNFLCAYYLKDHLYSNTIINNYTKGAGLAEFLKEKNLPFSNWDEAKSHFNTRIGESYVVIEAQAKAEIEKLLNNEKKEYKSMTQQVRKS